MLTTSLVLGPTVATMRGMRGTSGSAFALHRSISNVATSPQSYFTPMMGLFGTKHREREEPDNRGESNGSASGTHHGGSGSGSVSSGRGTRTLRTARSGHGPNAMHISGNQAQPGQFSIMEVDSSRAMVEDYVRYSLEKNGIPWDNGQRDVRPSEAQRAMRRLGDQLEETYGETIDMLINDLQFTPQNGQERLTASMQELFSDGEVNWGRVAVVVKFAGKLSVHCARTQRPQLINSIVDWVSQYVDTRLNSWIAQNDGWAGFVRFSKNEKESGSSALKNLIKVGVAAAGLLTLGALWRS